MEDLNFTRVETASIGKDAANVILQTEAWFNARRDQIVELGKAANDEKSKIIIGDLVIDDQCMKLGFATGLSVALQVLGDWPLTMNCREEDEDE